MKHTEQWIRLPRKIFNNEHTTFYGGSFDAKKDSYTVAEFKRNYVFSKKIVCAELRFSGDAVFQLFCNGSIIATGPACGGGDFIGNETARDNFYSFETKIFPDASELDFFARVQMIPCEICEFSRGQGGFYLSAILTFEDGSVKEICSNESWLVGINGAYLAPRTFDGRIGHAAYVPAELAPDIRTTETAPIPVRDETEILTEDGVFSLAPAEEKTVILELDKIWGGFIKVSSASHGEVHLKIMCREIAEETDCESIILYGKQTYRGFCMHSAGNIVVTAKNMSSDDIDISVCFIKTHYPVYDEAATVTDDQELNAVMETCKHTLKICRQTHHLDSTRHCEPLACTGDYYIEAMMTPFAFGDMRLAEFDIVRTAVMLERENGRMFHTTYSLIWVRMLYDVYMLTGNRDLLKRCKKALLLLLDRFETYVGENGLVETPPDYMFVDWIYIDGISMHHPPKALGQSCLNMFYFGALEGAVNIFTELGDLISAEKSRGKKEALRSAINSLLFDFDKGCYFEGLNTRTPPELIGEWMPQNVEKRYYLKHSNILAAYFGVCDDSVGKNLVDKIMTDEIGGDCQPYFMHYLLEAVYRLGLRERYTLRICERWKEPVVSCSKGLVEGFVAPEPTYTFDHSHAWGGTPLYSLPKAIMGLEITNPGMSEITLCPSLLGLSYAKSELLTPYGKVVCELKKGEKAKVTHPEEVKIILK